MIQRFPLVAMMALACAAGDLVLPQNGGLAVQLRMEAGNSQRGTIGGPLEEPLVVRVTDEFGGPVPDVVVEWSANDGDVDPAFSLTDADGLASTTRILGQTVGAQSATATSAGLQGSPMTFQHTAEAGEATRLVKVGGDRQTGTAGSELDSPLIVRLFDDDDIPIAGRAVTWLVTNGGGSIAPSSGVTDGTGRASARWTLGSSGSQAASAVVSGVGVVEFTATLRKNGDDDDDDDDGGKGGKGKSSKMVAARGNGQTTRVAAEVSIDPTVRVSDDQGIRMSK